MRIWELINDWELMRIWEKWLRIWKKRWNPEESKIKYELITSLDVYIINVLIWVTFELTYLDVFLGGNFEY